MKNNETNKYDIIGDIHGRFDKLTDHLTRLGYRRGDDHNIHHPEGRKVLFLGDYIDRGENNRDTLHLVKEMVDAGTATALMGNHEFNAVLMETEGPEGKTLRPRRENTDRTRAEFDEFPGEWATWIEWFKDLPMWIDFGEFRAVHATWDEKSMEFIGDRTLRDENFLRAAGTKGTPEFDAVEIVLKGHELKLPEGVSFFDKDGKERFKTRARWWGFDDDAPLTFGDIAMPPGSLENNAPVPREKVKTIPRYPESAPPVFVGHYWMDKDAPKEPVGPNVVILDYSAGMDGPVVSYRWNPGDTVSKEAFVLGEVEDDTLRTEGETPTVVDAVKTTFIVDESGRPWEIGAGFVKLVGAAEPLSDDKRARLTRTILSGSMGVSKEEAIRISLDLKK